MSQRRGLKRVNKTDSFSPLKVSDYIAWYYTDSISGGDGDPVSDWMDSTGHGYIVSQSVAASKPILKTNVVNGRPVARFDGVDDFLRNTAFYNFADNYTIFSVARYAVSADVDQGIFNVSENVASSRGIHQAFDVGIGEFNGFWNDTLENRITIAGDTRDGIFRVRTSILRAGAGAQMYWNGVSKGVRAYIPPRTFALSALDVGGLNTNTYRMNGDLAELVFYSRDLTDAERTSVESYLMTKYGV